MTIKIDISPGELIDKITILQIKTERIADAAKVDNVRRELDLLMKAWTDSVTTGPQVEELAARLKGINEKLWVIEDDIRDCERAKDFGPRFVELARAVYRTNDERMSVKREVNMLFESGIVEEKSYQPY